jgi:IS4 transposase
MSHQDMTSKTINHQAIKQAIDLLMPAALFGGMQVRRGARWKVRMLAVAAFLWGCLSTDTLEERFSLARDLADKLFRWLPSPGKTYEGFKKVLRSQRREVKLLLMEHWRDRMTIVSAPWTVEGFLVLGVDGSRVELPRTADHEEHYAASRKGNRKSQRKQSRRRNGKKRKTKAKAKANSKPQNQYRRVQSASTKKKLTSPQMWLTLLWHAGTGLPWDWRTGPSDSSERDHFREMVPQLPENTLITADAGFVGYEFWQSILDAGLQFVIRAGGNVKLLRNLGYARQHEQTVYLWPDDARKKGQPPLVLRLIALHDGKQPVYLVTNLPKSKLSDRQAAQVYRMRWGIELFFRTFKQTFQRRKLRSRKPEYAELELEWSLLALWGMLLAGQIELQKSGQDPRRQSPAETIRAFQKAITNYRLPPATEQDDLWQALRAAVLDDYERSSAKTSRSYPKKKQRERTGPPKIVQATEQQQLAAQELKTKHKQIRLAA